MPHLTAAGNPGPLLSAPAQLPGLRTALHLGPQKSVPRDPEVSDLGQVRQSISRHGWAVQQVGRGRFGPPVAYTVGLTGHARPELIVTGLPLRQAARLLDELAGDVLRAEPRPGTRIWPSSSPAIEIVEVTCPAAHLATAAELYGPGVRALQLVHADGLGHWPWDPGYRGFRGDQPVLGTPATPPPAPAQRSPCRQPAGAG